MQMVWTRSNNRKMVGLGEGKVFGSTNVRVNGVVLYTTFSAVHRDALINGRC